MPHAIRSDLVREDHLYGQCHGLNISVKIQLHGNGGVVNKAHNHAAATQASAFPANLSLSAGNTGGLKSIGVSIAVKMVASKAIHDKAESATDAVLSATWRLSIIAFLCA